jgi:hypothetical protein
VTADATFAVAPMACPARYYAMRSGLIKMLPMLDAVRSFTAQIEGAS